MRPKELRIVVTFETTTAAMAFENEAGKEKSPGKTDSGSKRDHRWMWSEFFCTDRSKRTDSRIDRAADI